MGLGKQLSRFSYYVCYKYSNFKMVIYSISLKKRSSLTRKWKRWLVILFGIFLLAIWHIRSIIWDCCLMWLSITCASTSITKVFVFLYRNTTVLNTRHTDKAFGKYFFLINVVYFWKPRKSDIKWTIDDTAITTAANNNDSSFQMKRRC